MLILSIYCKEALKSWGCNKQIEVDYLDFGSRNRQCERPHSMNSSAELFAISSIRFTSANILKNDLTEVTAYFLPIRPH